MKTAALLIYLLLNGFFAVSQTLQSVTDNGNTTTQSISIGTGYTDAKLNVNAVGRDVNNSNDLSVLITNHRYNSLNSSGENRVAFGWGNHWAAAISAYKETVNTTGFKFYTEYGFNLPVERMRVTPTGNVGIGKSNPEYKLDVIGQINVSGQSGGYTTGDIPKISFGGGDTEFTELKLPFGGPLEYKTYHGHVFKTYGGNNIAVERMRIDINGNVSIGTPDSKGYKLAVAGNIITESVKVQLKSSWPDYVFKKDYPLLSIDETEKYIKEKGHLPGIPSAEEVKANGINLGEMNAKLLKKIEELTLYLIELKKENDKERDHNKEQQILINQQQKDIEFLKSKL